MESKKPSRIFFLTYALIFIGVLVIGILAGKWQINRTSVELKEKMVQQIDNIAATLNPEMAKSLTFTSSDLSNPSYHQIRNHMVAVGSLFPIRGIYSMKLIDGEFRFGPESYEPEAPDASPPGTLYENPSPEDFSVYEKGNAMAFGPFEDEYGTFISAMAPVIDPRSGDVLMIIGIDIPADQYTKELNHASRFPYMIMAFALFLFLVGFANILINRYGKEVKSLRFRNTETILVGVSFLFLTFIITARTISDERKNMEQVFRNKAQRNAQAIHNELRNMDKNLDDLKRFIENQEHMSFDEFANFTTPSLNNSTAKGFVWIPKVSSKFREKFENEAIRYGLNEYFIKQQKNDGTLDRADQREFYYPVLFVIPEGENAYISGLDVGGLQEFEHKIESGFKNEMIYSAGFTRFVSESDEKQYILALSPIFGNEQRTMITGQKVGADSLYGFAGLIVDLKETVQTALHNLRNPNELINTNFYSLAGTGNISLVTAYPDDLKQKTTQTFFNKLLGFDDFVDISPIFVFDEDYACISTSNDEFHDKYPMSNSLITGIVGVLISFIFASIAWFWRNQQNLLDKTVAARTFELTERMKELSCLQKINNDLQQFITPEDLCKRCVHYITESFSEPNSVLVLIKLNNEIFISGLENGIYEKKISKRLLAFGQEVGNIEVTLHSEIAFLKEEEDLIQQVASLIGNHYEQHETERLRQHALISLQENEASLTFAQQIANMGSWEYNPGKQLVKWSDNNFRILGFEPNEVLPTPELFEQMAHPEDRHTFELTRKKLLATKQPVGQQMRFIKRDGREIWLETFTVGEFEGDKLVSFRGVNVDITDRKQSNEALLESKEKFRLIAENTGDIITLMDMNLKTTYTSPSILAIRGFTVEEAIEQTIDQIFTSESLLEFTRVFGEQIKQESPGDADSNRNVILQVEEYCKDGSTVWVEMVMSLIRDSHHKPIAIVSISRDITLRKKADEALKEAKEKAEASDRLKSAFMNTISHEIRTPLNGILGFGQMIVQEDLSQQDKADYLNILQMSSNRLIDTITDFMDISLITSGNLKPTISEFEIFPVLHESFNRLTTQANEKNLDTKLLLPMVASPIILKTDLELLVKTINHLTNNAVKFTPKGTIWLGVNLLKGQIEIFVKDTGIGITEEAKQRVFERFSQEENSSTRNYEGSGLGLSIANGIMKMLGGELKMESEKGKGSTFSLLLPYSGTDVAIVSAETPDTQAVSIEKPIVLLAEDDDSNAYFIKIILDRAGCGVIHVTNGLDAVEQCKLNPAINLIIMDIKMPKMNGLEATRLIKEIRPDLPVIAVTAYALTGDEHRILASGCNEYLPKPFNKETILQKVSKYIKLV